MIARPPDPTIAQIREVSQPVSVTGRSNAEHWVADLYLRRISPYLTRLLLKTPITANGVTYLMITTGISISVALLIPGNLGLVLALVFSQLQMLWDCCDGEIARWRQTQSPKGIFLDRLGHYFAEGLIPIALALRLNNWPNSKIDDYKILFLASLISSLIIFNKACNESVHAARALSGLSKLDDSKEVGKPRFMLLTLLSTPFRIFAVQRLFHSVEMTIVIFIFSAQESLIQVGLYLAFFITLGHIMMILNSRKLVEDSK